LTPLFYNRVNSNQHCNTATLQRQERTGISIGKQTYRERGCGAKGKGKEKEKEKESRNQEIMADLSTTLPLTRASVIEAHKLVKPHVHRTPVLTNRTLTTLASTPRGEAELIGTAWKGREPARPVIRLWFKCENLQRIGAFKARGAFHAIEKLKMEPGWVEGGGMEKGVVTHSSGKGTQLPSSQFC
jgi:hypothetical protein